MQIDRPTSLQDAWQDPSPTKIIQCTLKAQKCRLLKIADSSQNT